MHLVGDGEQFDRLLTAARAYRGHLASRAGGGRCVVAEALHEDIRVIVRNLLIANAICDLLPARLVVLTGMDREWSDTLWEEFDVQRIRRLAEAFGAAEVVNVHDLVDRHLAEPGDTPAEGIDPETLRTVGEATLIRLSRVPRLPPFEDHRQRARRDRTRAIAACYDRLFTELSPDALVTSHVDYDQWGLAVDTAMRGKIPIVHVQSTGSMKAYTLFPESYEGSGTFREQLTPQIAAYFHEHVWPHRDLIRPDAELVAWRAKGNLGRPSWWRAGNKSNFEVHNGTERRQLRRHGCERFGMDPDRPVFTIFNHAVSDALGTNREIFDDLAQWFEETAEFAATEDSVNWLFLDHPSQHRYDTTGHFEALAARHSARPHLTFMPSLALSKNVMWSMTDVGVTVRGSVASELPAFGIPVIQAGWSEWSGCGLSHVAETRDDYWRLLGEAVARHTKGESILGPEQRERARLWLWFYRSGADVPSPLTPHWELGAGNEYMRALTVHMEHVERDGDPLHRAVRRMWERRDPVLSRLDFHDLPGVRHDQDPSAERVISAAPIIGTATDFDHVIAPREAPIEIFSGQEPALQVVDQLHRGIQIVGRFEGSGLAGFKVASGGRRLRVTLSLAVDAGSVRGWHIAEDATGTGNGLPRLIQIRAQGRLRQCVLLKDGSGTRSGVAVFDLPPEEVPDDGLICIEVLDIMEGHDISGALREAVAGSVMDDGVAGVRIDGVTFEESPADLDPGVTEETLDGARCEVSSLISSGGLANLNRRGTRSMPAGLFVVNPVPASVFGSGGSLIVRLGNRTETRTLRSGGYRALARMAWRRGEAPAAPAPAVWRVLSVQDDDLAAPAQVTTSGVTELELPAPAASPLLLTAPETGVVPTLVSVTWRPKR
ncbi:hypothetical protein [Nonomuraea sp. NPDC049480]|uniref:hypothetical protein n=1 Tax=Nonomuraea sp. NPDC049480 TaxID=3364353 RepID=UPI0037AABA9D